jgi:hypothetical protein
MDLEIPIRLQKSVYRLVSDRDAHVFIEGAIIESTQHLTLTAAYNTAKEVLPKPNV